MKVIIPVFINNEATLELTRNTIDSFGQEEFVIVDNNSSLGGGYVRSIANIYIRNQENLGYAKAVNQGMKLCDGPMVIANNDIRVSPNWKEVTTSILKEEPRVHSLHFRMTPYDVPFEYGVLTSYTGKERWCTGSFFVLRDNSFLFDENFFNSYDDWDLSRRIRQSGKYTVYTNRACYQHNFSFTQQQIPNRNENNEKNKEYFKKKWGAYAEDLFTKDFPEQMAQDYQGGFDI